MPEKDDKLKLAEERAENARKRVAKALNLLETSVQELKWACEDQGWNDEVVYQIEDASVKLGFALATLTCWDDPSTEDS